MSTLPANRSLFREPDFLRLWLAGFVAFSVRWLEILVFGVFTYRQADSAFLVAGMIMLRLLPMALFGLPFGAYAARMSRRLGLLVSFAVLALVSTTLAIIAALDQLAIWHLALAALINGVAWAGDNPLRRGLIGDVVGPLRMGRAMALDVGSSHACRLLGPALGGFLLARHGMASVFMLITCLYAIALFAMALLQYTEVARDRSPMSLRSMLATGLSTARESPRLAGALWITLIFNVFGWPVLSMVPVIGQDRLGLDAEGIGLLASMDGGGALVGAFLLSLLSRPQWYGRLYVGGISVFLVMLPLFAMSEHAIGAGAALLILGVGSSAFSVMQATIVFISAPADRRVQAMGLLTMCIGMGPIGFLQLGWLAEWLGAPTAAVCSAMTGLVLLGLSWPWWRACWRNEQPPDA